MIRVLQVLGSLGLGGAESRIMDLYRHMDRSRCQFDFLVTKGTGDYYAEEIKELGGNIYYLPPFRVVNITEYIHAVKSFFKEHHDYSAVHGHMTSTAGIYLPIAKGAGIPLLIAHARSAGVDPGLKGIATRILRRNLADRCDVCLTCSDEAGVAVFGRKAMEQGRVVFLPNAVDTKSFRPNENTRNELINRYNLHERYVVGHVGSFRYAKNHEFLIKIFAALSSEREDAVLMLLGDGPLRENIEKLVTEVGLNDKVIFTGNVTPVAPYYSLFNSIIFPSHYEGMPGTIVEAQAAGVPCLISDTITRQVKATDLVEFMSLDKSPEEWAKAALMQQSHNRRGDKPLRETLYDVNQQVEYYMNLYRA